MAKIVRLTSELLRQELAKLEHDHGMTSVEFYEHYQAGDLKESEAFMRWAWLCAVALRRGMLTASRAHA
jgi:hypothetical protein